MLKKYPLIQAIDDVRNTLLASAFSVSYTWRQYHNDGSISLTTTSVAYDGIFKILETQWPSWALVYDNKITADKTWFADLFSNWKSRNVNNLANMASAYNPNYNPFNNYNGREQYTRLGNSGHVDTETTHDVPEYTDTITDSNVRTGSQTTSGQKTETRDDTASVSTFDSAVLGVTDNTQGSTNTTGDSYTTSYDDLTDTGGGSTTHGAHTDTDTTTLTHHNALNGSAEYSGGTDLFGNTVTGGDEYVNEIRTRAGNLGITSTQDMIHQELDLRHYDILVDWLGQFIAQYCILSPNVAEGGTEWD